MCMFVAESVFISPGNCTFYYAWFLCYLHLCVRARLFTFCASISFPLQQVRALQVIGAGDAGGGASLFERCFLHAVSYWRHQERRPATRWRHASFCYIFFTCAIPYGASVKLHYQLTFHYQLKFLALFTVVLLIITHLSFNKLLQHSHTNTQACASWATPRCTFSRPIARPVR